MRNACSRISVTQVLQALHEALHRVLPEVLASPSFPTSRARRRVIGLADSDECCRRPEGALRGVASELAKCLII